MSHLTIMGASILITNLSGRLTFGQWDLGIFYGSCFGAGVMDIYWGLTS